MPRQENTIKSAEEQYEYQPIKYGYKAQTDDYHYYAHVNELITGEIILPVDKSLFFYGSDDAIVQFTNAICLSNQPPIALLGGVGIAVSGQTQHKKAISQFLNFIMQDQIVSGSYFDAGSTKMYI